LVDPQGWNAAYGINDAEDIVGESNSVATRWSARDTNFVQALGFPGDWSLALRVNSNGVAVGGYGVANSPERAVAQKFR
jgi:hypothetical protein